MCNTILNRHCAILIESNMIIGSFFPRQFSASLPFSGIDLLLLY